MKRVITLCLNALFLCPALAQDSTKAGQLTISGFVDMYYQYDFDNPASRERPSFLYNYRQHNEFNVNLALIKATYTHDRVTAHIGLMTGNYAHYNMAAEDPVSRIIYEANVGYRMSRKWSLDAGVLPSHIGLESAVSRDNWALSRSLTAEASPYFETGIRCTYKPNDRWSAALLVLNGWQNIRETNSSKAAGTQVQWTPNDRWLINSSTFIGNEKPDSAKQLRLFHDLYITCALSKKWNAAVIFDIGGEREVQEDHFNTWYGTGLLLQYKMREQWAACFRAEYYADPHGVVVSLPGAAPFRVSGYSVNLDYQPSAHIVFRTEGRYLASAENIFYKDGQAKGANFSWLTSVSVGF
jgi:hypothetical protein